MTSNWSAGDACQLPATAALFLARDPQPGIILVELIDASGRPHQLVDKTAVFSAELSEVSDYPQPTLIPCHIQEINGDIATVTPTFTISRAGLPFLFDVRVDVLAPTLPHLM